MKIKVSGVPYEVDNLQVGEHFYVKHLENEVNALRAENKSLKDRIKALIEECCWLESKTREIKQSTQGEH